MKLMIAWLLPTFSSALEIVISFIEPIQRMYSLVPASLGLTEFQYLAEKSVLLHETKVEPGDSNP